MKISGAVRVIKGQEVLPDGSTLEEHEIIDGSTVNIVIEPEKEIKLRMKLGPKEFIYQVSNSVRVRELKQQLIDGDIVGFSINEFQLFMNKRIAVEDNDEGNDVLLEDESLPLHLLGVADNTKIKIMGWSIMIEVISQKGEKLFRHFPRIMTVKQLKKGILAEHISLFVKRDTRYRKLDDEAPLGDVLSHKDVVHYIEGSIFGPRAMVKVFHKGMKIEVIGCAYEETVLSLKLRVQEHLGFPVSSLQVKCIDPKAKRIIGNNEIMDLPAQNYQVLVL